MTKAIILLHNHPHGSKKPSKKDKRTFESLKLIGELHDIKLKDFTCAPYPAGAGAGVW